MDRDTDFATSETLQACASISVSKLCNFPLPCLVNFVNIYYSVCFPKYLRLPVLTKYFVKNCLFVSWGRPQFSLLYLNIGPLLHLQYTKIHKKAFSQSYRYGKYLSFAALVTPITFLGAEQFVFPCTLFFAEFQLKKVLSMSRNQNWSLLRQNNSKSIWRVSKKLDL